MLVSILCAVLLISFIDFTYINSQQNSLHINQLTSQAAGQRSQLNKQLQQTQEKLTTLQNQDQYKRNQKLQSEIQDIQKTYKQAVNSYESMLDLGNTKHKDEYDKSFAQALNYLSDQNYASAASTLTALQTKIDQEKQANAVSVASTNAPPATASNTPPGSGYSRQSVQTDVGTFTVDIIAADLSSTKVIVDTASDSDCSNNCPVLPLSSFVSRTGAYAGINGSYFCPAAYPSCAGKTNSFDLLVMNKDKHYFNSDNNVYSTNPAVIFGNGWIRFVDKVQEWGRDTSVDGVLSNYPLLVYNHQNVFGGTSDTKMTGKGTRGFVANKGNTIYIGFVENATMTDSSHVMQTMGMDNAMNLDEGGSTALWYGGYKLGPGRDLANSILFVRK